MLKYLVPDLVYYCWHLIFVILLIRTLNAKARILMPLVLMLFPFGSDLTFQVMILSMGALIWNWRSIILSWNWQLSFGSISDFWDQSFITRYLSDFASKLHQSKFSAWSLVRACQVYFKFWNEHWKFKKYPLFEAHPYFGIISCFGFNLRKNWNLMSNFRIWESSKFIVSDLKMITEILTSLFSIVKNSVYDGLNENENCFNK